MKTRRLTTAAMLTAVALTLFVVEAQIPMPVPVPGVKLGLANVVTVSAVFLLGGKQAAAILLVRIVLGSLYAGFSTFPYALAGGLCSIGAVLTVRRFLRPGQIWVASVLGGMFHNIGQMAAALLITQTPSLVVYLPVLLISGMLTGLFTGLCAQFAVPRLQSRIKGKE